MATYIGCIAPQISRVLKKENHFTLDQASKVISFLELSKWEGHYFTGLVELARAGNNERREIVEERLEGIKKKLSEVPRGFKGDKSSLSREDYEFYYKSWICLAIEILTSIPKYQNVDAICEYLHLPKKEVLKNLNFLVEKGLITKNGDKYNRDSFVSLLGKPPEIYRNKHHVNWRTRALNSIDQREENNLNLTIVTSFPKKDIGKVIDFLHEKSAELLKSLEDSTPEELRCLCIDFFKVK